jgi:hypothetical protein
MDDYPEILFLDFDCRACKVPNAAMWEALRCKKGRFAGVLQAMNVGYVRPICLEIVRRRALHPVRRCLSTAVVYCSDHRWLDRWLHAFTELLQLMGDRAFANTEETVLMYLLDKECGVLDSATMVQEFEIPIARARRSIPEAQQLKDGDQVYFTHR